MLGVSDYCACVVAVLVFLLIPAPGNLTLMTSTAKGAIRGGHGVHHRAADVCLWRDRCAVAAFSGRARPRRQPKWKRPADSGAFLRAPSMGAILEVEVLP